MRGDPKTRNHPPAVFLITIFVWCIVLFVLAGVINHLAFSSEGPGLLRPLLKKIQTQESPEQAALREHRAAEEHQRFHHLVPFPQLPATLRSTCYICHTHLPHNKSKKIRAMLNMHTTYLTCESCHLKKDKGETIVYKWYSPMEKDPKGPFFGTSYNPETGALVMTGDDFAKIAPFHKQNGHLTPIVHMQDTATAREYMRIRDQLTPEKQKERTQRFHVDVLAKGPDCRTCHTTGGILDFKALGFSAKRTVDIEQLNIKDIITHYEEFYLPDLFKQWQTTGSEGNISNE